MRQLGREGQRDINRGGAIGRQRGKSEKQRGKESGNRERTKKEGERKKVGFIGLLTTNIVYNTFSPPR